MASPKKDGIYLNITKTLIVERALLAYMDDFDKKQETLKKIADGIVTVIENEQADQ